ncbi:unnamed protein product [Closterium sp. Naga37s-1]|nr:unnamed protein product [Closterium sp. Naga37s-1]
MQGIHQVDLTVVHSLVRRMIIFISERYIDCGNILARIQASDCRPSLRVTREAAPSRQKAWMVTDALNATFRLHGEELTGYSDAPRNLESCFKTCRSYVLSAVDNLQRRFKDLDTLNGSKLFMPDTWPRDTASRNDECVAHLDALFQMFHIGERREVLPGGLRMPVEAVPTRITMI